MIPPLNLLSFGDTIYHIMAESCHHFIELYLIIEIVYYHFIEKHTRFYCFSHKSIVNFLKNQSNLQVG